MLLIFFSLYSLNPAEVYIKYLSKLSRAVSFWEIDSIPVPNLMQKQDHFPNSLYFS